MVDRRAALGSAAAMATALIVLVVIPQLVSGLPWGQRPTLTIESGSMMECQARVGVVGADCEATAWGRLGTLDPGDLVFLRKAGTVATAAEGGDDRFGGPGDVIVFEPRAIRSDPVIHRALYWLDIHGDGDYSVPALGLYGLHDLDHPDLLALGGPRDYDDVLEALGAGPEDSGYVTRGDNNLLADQPAAMPFPVRPQDIVGKASAEIPWLGLMPLKARDTFQATDLFGDVPPDLQLVFWVQALALTVAVVAVAVRYRRASLKRRYAGRRPE